MGALSKEDKLLLDIARYAPREGDLRRLAALVRRLAGRVEELERHIHAHHAADTFNTLRKHGLYDSPAYREIAERFEAVRRAPTKTNTVCSSHGWVSVSTDCPRCAPTEAQRMADLEGNADVSAGHPRHVRAPTEAPEDPRVERWIEESKRFTKQATAYGRSIAVRADVGSSWQPEKERPLYGVRPTPTESTGAKRKTHKPWCMDHWVCECPDEGTTPTSEEGK